MSTSSTSTTELGNTTLENPKAQLWVIPEHNYDLLTDAWQLCTPSAASEAAAATLSEITSALYFCWYFCWITCRCFVTLLSLLSFAVLF